MIEKHESHWKRQVRNLLLVIGSSMLFAVLVASFLVYYYGPTGSFVVKNILLSPEYLQTLSYESSNPESGKWERFVFERVEYVHFDASTNQWEKEQISLDLYKNLYHHVKNDKSIHNIEGKLSERFIQTNPSSLTIVVHSAKGENAAKVFQEIQFLTDEEMYRIKLPNDSKENEWVYFNHPDINNQIVNILLP